MHCSRATTPPEAAAPPIAAASSSLAARLNDRVERYETSAFIEDDPIRFPHRYEDPRDQEVIGLYAALLAWGRRSIIRRKLEELCERMGDAPYRFVRTYERGQNGALDGFVHRTFQPIDARWLTHLLGRLLERYGRIETVFAEAIEPEHPHVGPAIQHFSTALLEMDPDRPDRLRKHLARPEAGSACKRLNMYLRWMVRPGPVDLGIWNAVRPAQLVMPLDVHAATQARKLGILERKSTDWKAALEVTRFCRTLAPEDPARYDFALFGQGIAEAEGTA